MSNWDYPGARWWKFDFHTHTPASIDFVDKQMSCESWLRGFMEIGIDCVAITDHNSGDWIDRLKQKLDQLKSQESDWYRPLYLFPGVEISANGGVHILAIFDPEKTTSDLDSLLGAVRYRGTKGASDSETQKSLSEVVKLVVEHGGVVIPAHVDKQKGLFESLSGKSLELILRDSNIYAMELCDGGYCKPELYTSEKTQWVEVCGSDFHAEPDSAIGTFTWVKMASPSIEGLRLALIDGIASVNRDMDAEPNHHAEFVIEQLCVNDAKYIGRPEALTCRFSPFLNTIIGGRGSGKSTLLEFMRLTLRQEQNLPDRLKDDYRDYFRTDEEGGLLTKDSRLQLHYRKGDTHYRLNWSEVDDVHGLEEQHMETGIWNLVEGEIDSLFPASIYSQKQIFELASRPQGLMRIIDRVPEVGIDEFHTTLQSCSNAFKQLYQRKKELTQKISEENKLKGQLNDLARQIKQVRNKILQKKHSGYENLLQNYRLRQRQLREIQNVEAHWDEIFDTLNEGLSSSDGIEVSEQLFTQHPEILHDLRTKQNQWQRCIEEILGIVEGQQENLRDWKAQKVKREWMDALNRDLRQYEELRAQLEAVDIDPQSYPDLLQKHSQVEEELKQIGESKQQIKEIKERYKEKHSEAEQCRAALTHRREQYLQRVLEGSQSVNIRIDPFAEPWVDVEKKIRRILQTESHFRKDFDELRRIYHESQNGWKNVKKRITDIIYDRFAPEDQRFKSHLRGLPGESRIDLLFWFPEDGLQVTYGPDNQKLNKGSPGEKSAALLAFILAHGDEPLLLDQPEDDLDNDLIYNLIVQSIKSTKAKRQIIVITHNANIVVNGDSEMVHILSVAGGQSHMISESLQSNEIRRRICDSMEGGSKAFEQRYRRIHLEV